MKKCVAAAYLSFMFTGVLGLRAETPPPLRIMPLGDSITYGANTGGGYRLPLYLELTAAGYNIDYVGNETSNSDSGLGAEIHHEGHSGWRISASGNGIYENILGWLDRVDDPDIVLLHVGTNDTNDSGFEDKIDKYNDLILRIAEARPYAHIIATTLLKRGADDNDGLYTKIKTQFNPYVEDLVAAHQAAGRRVHFLDMHAYLERSDMYDNLHPSAEGYGKMADAWYPVVTSIATPWGDKLPPDVTAVRSVSPSEVSVTFSKPIDLAASSDLTKLSSYSLSPAGSVVAVSGLSSDKRTLTLSLEGVEKFNAYTLTLNAEVFDLVPVADGGPYSTTVDTTFDFIVQPATPYAEDVFDGEHFEGWLPLHTLDIPTHVRYGRDMVNYKVSYVAQYNNQAFERVAYYMALQRSGQPLRYVWVEMDPFTQDASKLGVPTTASGAFFQQYLSNLKVLSNSPYITEGEFESGNIEFWPCNYHNTNEPEIPGASGDHYDFGDKATNGDHGSMQIHNTALGETLFAMSNWGKSNLDGGAPTIGIGIGTNPDASSNSSGPQRDWTFASNAPEFRKRILQVFVKPGVVAPIVPEVGAVYTGYDRRHIAVHFSELLMAESVVASCFELSDGVEVIDAVLHRDGKSVTLATALQPLDKKLQLTVSGVRSLKTATATPERVVTVEWLPPEIEADVPAAANGYRVVYGLDMGVLSDFGGSGPAPYFFKASDSSESFERVGYYLALGQRAMYSPAREYVWTSMDPFTHFISKIGVPNRSVVAIFAEYVTNLEVRSNKSGMHTGMFEQGNIEFWPSNYGAGNANGIPGASGSNFDFGDSGYSMSVGHGSMQVHNYLKGQTVFGISEWGDNRANPFGIGIGNTPSTHTSNSNDKDWTFAKNAPYYSSRRLYVLARPASDTASTLAAPTEVVERVAEAADYKHLYTIEVPALANFSDATKRATYYTVNNVDLLAGSEHTRVAYFYELVKGGNTNYCWTAFDAITDDLDRLGVPVGSENYFQQTVANLDVRSNVPGVVNTTGSGTGNIEFWATNYSEPNEAGVPNASGSAFDFGDKRSTTGSYGSMQVHNHGASQTLWALNQFNTSGSPVCSGIGNQPSGHPDWTFRENGGEYDSIRLIVLIESAYEPIAERQEIPEEVAVRVPEVSEYEHLYTVDIPGAGARFDNVIYHDFYYSVNNAPLFARDKFDRVGYFFELVKDGVTNYCWTAFDAFTDNLAHLGVPKHAWHYQSYISNLDVKSNVAGVTEVTGAATGNIEFWANDYTAANASGIPGASGSKFDFGDSRNTGGSYGSMQVHNHGAGQTLWAFNRFNHESAAVCAGIGNRPTGEPDWTHAGNGNDYDSRRLLVFVRLTGEGVAESEGGVSVRNVAGQGSLDRVLVMFDQPVSDASVRAENFTADNGLEIVGAAMHPAYAKSCVVLTTTAQSPGTSYTLGISGVQSRSVAGGKVAPGYSVSFTAKSEAMLRPELLSQVAESGDYKLVQRLSIERPNYWTMGAPYALDDTWPAIGDFDRVAYLMDLPKSDGTPNWVWVSMDAFTTDPLRLGIPTADRIGRFQQYVYNMNVYAPPAVSTITSGTYTAGNIEFWPNNYTEPNAGGVPGASGSKFDFGDQVSDSTLIGHGCFQVHNFSKGEVLFALNNWGTDNRSMEMGIGNRGESHSDWTHSGAYTDYAARTLYVFVRPSAVPVVEPVPDPGWGSLPVVVIDPEGQLVKRGTGVTLKVSAIGAERYQWRKDGVLIPGATSFVLDLPETEWSDSGNYDVLVYGNGSIYTVSDTAALKLISEGTILLVK